jgi:hypothetical protein
MAALPPVLGGAIGTLLTGTAHRGIRDWFGANQIQDPAERTAAKTQAVTEAALTTGGPMAVPYVKFRRGQARLASPADCLPQPAPPPNTAPGMPFAPAASLLLALVRRPRPREAERKSGFSESAARDAACPAVPRPVPPVA